MYQVEMGTHAWLTGINNIAVVRTFVKSGMVMNGLIKKLDQLQRENPDLHDVFEKKKRDGLLTPEEAAGQKNNGDEERESIKSEDSLSASNSSLTHSNIQSPTPMTSNSDQYATPSSTVTHRYGVEDENSPSPTTSSRSDSRCKSSPK